MDYAFLSFHLGRKVVSRDIDVLGIIPHATPLSVLDC